MSWIAKIGGKVWAPLAAVVGLVLAVFGFTKYWNERKRANKMARMAARLAIEEEKRVRERVAAEKKKDDAAIVTAVNNSARDAVDEVNKNDSTLGSWLRRRGATRDPD